jgi:hypothetical protein
MKSIDLNSLTARQAARWFLIHERERHLQDIQDIDADLFKLRDVDLPPELIELAGRVHFRVVADRG